MLRNMFVFIFFALSALQKGPKAMGFLPSAVESV